MDINDLASQDPEQIKQLINLLSALLPKNNNSDDEPEEDNSPIRTKKTKMPKKFKNKFLDMPEKNMHKEDIEIDRALQKYPPTARARKASFVEVSCRVCGKKETVSSSLVMESRDRYKCNKCSKSAG